MQNQLTTEKLKTVGQILDFLEAFLNLIFMNYQRDSACIVLETEIFNNFFNLLPEAWSSDPVKTHLLTKLIHEQANDFNNSLFICSKLIAIKKKLCCYVGLTLFWALYKGFFNDEGTFQFQKYYKMHSVNKFFKLLPSDEQLTNLNTDLKFKFLSLISIYVNYILLSDDKDDHGVFQEFFQSNKSDIDRFKPFLQNFRRIVESSGSSRNKGNIEDFEHQTSLFSVRCVLFSLQTFPYLFLSYRHRQHTVD